MPRTIQRRSALAFLVLLAGFALALALRPGTTPAAGTPRFQASQGVVVFDFIPVGSTSTKDDMITNTGTGPLTFGKVLREGLHPQDFTLPIDQCSAKTLQPGDSCLLRIRFAPSVDGTRVASLHIPDNTQCDNYITLAGSGTDTSAPVTARAATCPSTDSQSTVTVTTTTTTTTTTPAQQPVSGQARITAPTRCVSRRRITLHLDAPGRTSFVKVSVLVRGRLFRTFRGKRIAARLNLSGLPRGRFTVQVHGTLSDGRRVSLKRHYTTCVRNYGTGG